MEQTKQQEKEKFSINEALKRTRSCILMLLEYFKRHEESYQKVKEYINEPFSADTPK